MVGLQLPRSDHLNLDIDICHKKTNIVSLETCNLTLCAITIVQSYHFCKARSGVLDLDIFKAAFLLLPLNSLCKDPKGELGC